MMIRLLSILSFGVLIFAGCISNAHTSAPWPSDNSAPAIAEALGVNIHFTDPKPGELAMLARLTSVTGESNGEKMITEAGLTLKLSNSPQYLEAKPVLR